MKVTLSNGAHVWQISTWPPPAHFLDSGMMGSLFCRPRCRAIRNEWPRIRKLSNPTNCTVFFNTILNWCCVTGRPSKWQKKWKACLRRSATKSSNARTGQTCGSLDWTNHTDWGGPRWLVFVCLNVNVTDTLGVPRSQNCTSAAEKTDSCVYCFDFAANSKTCQSIASNFVKRCL